MKYITGFIAGVCAMMIWVGFFLPERYISTGEREFLSLVQGYGVGLLIVLVFLEWLVFPVIAKTDGQ